MDANVRYHKDHYDLVKRNGKLYDKYIQMFLREHQS